MLWVIDVAVHSFFWNIFVNGLHRFFWLKISLIIYTGPRIYMCIKKGTHVLVSDAWSIQVNDKFVPIRQKKRGIYSQLAPPPTHPPSHHHHRLWKWCMGWPWTRGPSCWTCHGGRRCWGAPVSPGPLCLVGWQVHRNATLENDENDSVSLQASTDIMISKDSF